MDQLYDGGLISWGTFFLVVLGVSGVYAALAVLRRRLERGLYLREADGRVRSFLRLFLLSYSPLGSVAILVAFVAVHPLLFGPGAALVIALAWRSIRDFVAGRVLRFDRAVSLGRKLTFGADTATVADFGLTGLYLEGEGGRARLPYTELLRGGYRVAGDPLRGGYFHVEVLLPDDPAEVDPKRARGADRELQRLRDHLVENPYVRAGFRLDRRGDRDPLTGAPSSLVDVGVGVHRAAHLDHLLAQLREAGYSASAASA